MRTALCLLICPVMAAQGAAPKEVAGKDLAAVPGPFVDRYCGVPGYHDPTAGPGNSPIQMQIRESARRGPSIPAVALPEGPVAVADTIGSPAGWKAYRVDVPPGAKVHARVHGPHQGWFLVRTVNRMGTLEKGMLQNLMLTGNPEASYTNPKTETNTIFFVVDTTEPDVNGEPYTLAVDWTAGAKP
ncbi:MAG TPA: hypothetical protein VFM84_03890 [Holophagaceae bacterium]|nr:hypothetical protein [Holophagaceae bacterium]